MGDFKDGLRVDTATGRFYYPDDQTAPAPTDGNDARRLREAYLRGCADVRRRYGVSTCSAADRTRAEQRFPAPRQPRAVTAPSGLCYRVQNGDVQRDFGSQWLPVTGLPVGDVEVVADLLKNPTEEVR